MTNNEILSPGWQQLERQYHKYSAETPFNPWVGADTARDLAGVAEQHELTADELLEKLRDQTVLDVGAGNSLLEDGARKRGVETEVIPLNLPSTYFNRVRGEIVSRTNQVIGSPNRAVVGIGQELPIKTESVDLVIATYSLPFYATSSQVVVSFLDEGLRVLKPGGEMLIAPGGTAIGGPDETGRSVQASLLGKLIDLRDTDGINVDIVHDSFYAGVVIQKDN